MRYSASTKNVGRSNASLFQAFGSANIRRPHSVELMMASFAGKFASIKRPGGQADTTRASLLWIDLFDEDAWVLSAEAFAPIVIHQGQFFSMGGWHGFYGLADTPLFEGDEPQWGVLREAKLLGFDGRFARGSDWAAVILSLPECTLLFENHAPGVRIPDSVRDRLVDLDRLDLGKSWFTYPKLSTPVTVRIDQTTADLKALYRHGGRLTM